MNRPSFTPEQVPGIIEQVRSGKLRQLAVTQPYKKRVINLVDEVSDVVQEMGAANTITRTKEGKIRADNTDWVGVYQALLATGENWKEKKVLVITTLFSMRHLWGKMIQMIRTASMKLLLNGRT